MFNINEFRDEVHVVNKAKGFWEKPRAYTALMMLVVTEMAEATEEARKGTPAFYFNDADGKIVAVPNLQKDNFMVCYSDSDEQKMAKPEGELIEIADTAIRLLDMAGHYGVDIELAWEEDDATKEAMIAHAKHLTSLDSASAHLFIVNMMCKTLQYGHKENINYSLMTIKEYCLSKSWNLEEAMQLKLAYNKTRSHRHGGKLF